MRKGGSIRLGDLGRYRYVLCLDVEFTCWENSLRDGWPDPKYPPEILQIGLVGYDNITEETISEYVSFVRPVMNPVLSDYCKHLLRLSQQTIDRAPNLAAVFNEIRNFLLDYRLESCCLCSFGTDPIRIFEDAGRQKLLDPFDSFTWLDLYSEASKVLSVIAERGSERLAVRQRLKLTESLHRHDALDDARDVKLLLDALNRAYLNSDL